MGSVVINADAVEEQQNEVNGDDDEDNGGGAPGVKFRNTEEAERTLADSRFMIGDFIDCAIFPPLPDGSVAPGGQRTSYAAGGVGGSRGMGMGMGAGPPPPRENGYGRSRGGGYGPGRGDGLGGGGGGRGPDFSGGRLPPGEWRRGERLPDSGYGRGYGGRGRGRGGY